MFTELCHLQAIHPETQIRGKVGQTDTESTLRNLSKCVCPKVEIVTFKRPLQYTVFIKFKLNSFYENNYARDLRLKKEVVT